VSILSDREDGIGFFYGWLEGENRQINVRNEPGHHWRAWVGDHHVGDYATKGQAESAAISWAKANPEKGDAT
jgi:hypothetical protein